MRPFLAMLLLSTAALAHTVTLTWQLSPANDAIRQSIYRQVDCTGPWVRRANVSTTTVEWVDEHVKDGKTYCYYVSVTTNTKETAASNVAQAVIPTE